MEKILLAGFGGQGVLSLGQILAYAAMTEGKEVSWLPSYGPEMRGGTANCSVIISEKPIASPIVARPTLLVAMNGPSLVKFEDKVAPGGVIMVNSSLIERKVQRTDVKAYYIPANDLAIKCGTARAANIIMYGAINSHCKILLPESVQKGLEYAFKKKPHLIPMNEVAYRTGFEAVEQHG